jgi:hypothetical protein
MSERDKTEVQHLQDLFEGAKGRRPQTDQELKDWLASPEGKAAMAFEPTSVSRWGEIGRFRHLSLQWWQLRISRDYLSDGRFKSEHSLCPCLFHGSVFLLLPCWRFGG